MIGILPCAGHAERMRGIPKPFLPIPDDTVLMGRIVRLMNAVTDDVACIPSRNLLKASWGAVNGCRFMYTRPVETETMSETVLSAQQSCKDENILLGLADTYIEDKQAFVKLSACLDDGADVAVGVFHAREGQHTEGGMVHFYAGIDKDTKHEWNIVREIVDKPVERQKWKEPDWIWGVLAWRPAFWQHIHAEDEHVGFGVQRAVEAGMDVRAVKMDGGFWDCGVPSRYFALIRHLTGG